MSPNVIEIGDVQAARGEKKTGYLNVYETAVETVRIPLAIINGAKPGPTLCINAGVHGPECSSIEAVIRVFRQTEPAVLKGALLIVPVLNMAGFEARGTQGGWSTPFQNPIDCLNLGRAMAVAAEGNPEGSASYQISWAFLDQIASKADYHLDCHGGDLNEELVFHLNIPETGDSEKDRVVKEVLAASFDCEYLKPMKGGGAVFRRYGIPSMVVEGGGFGRVSEEAVQFIVNGITNLMKRLKMIEGEPTPTRKQRVLKLWRLYVKRGGVLSYTAPIGKRVKKGDKVVEVRNIFGELLETIEAPIDGVVGFKRAHYPVSANQQVLAIYPDEEGVEPPARAQRAYP